MATTKLCTGASISAEALKLATTAFTGCGAAVGAGVHTHPQMPLPHLPAAAGKPAATHPPPLSAQQLLPRWQPAPPPLPFHSLRRLPGLARSFEPTDWVIQIAAQGWHTVQQGRCPLCQRLPGKLVVGPTLRRPVPDPQRVPVPANGVAVGWRWVEWSHAQRLFFRLPSMQASTSPVNSGLPKRWQQ